MPITARTTIVVMTMAVGTIPVVRRAEMDTMVVVAVAATTQVGQPIVTELATMVVVEDSIVAAVDLPKGPTVVSNLNLMGITIMVAATLEMVPQGSANSRLRG